MIFNLIVTYCMISSKGEYLAYLEADRESLSAKTVRPILKSNNSMVWLTDPLVRFQKLLRKVEYYENCHPGKAWMPIRIVLRYRFQQLSLRLGLTIPINTFGPGLCILHYGSIVVSRHAVIGSNCTLNSGVNIGIKPGGAGAPKIGNNCYVGPGAKLWNHIIIADNVTIGANACVSKSIEKPGSTVVGVNRILNSAKVASNPAITNSEKAMSEGIAMER